MTTRKRFCRCFSALQRAEIAEIKFTAQLQAELKSFSALQRAEIAEIVFPPLSLLHPASVSVLFNEPKLLKLARVGVREYVSE